MQPPSACVPERAAPSVLFTVALDAAGGYGPAARIGTDLARLLEARPPGPFFTADPNV